MMVEKDKSKRDGKGGRRSGESEKCKAAGLCGRSCNRATETGPGASVEGGRYLSARMGTINLSTKMGTTNHFCKRQNILGSIT